MNDLATSGEVAKTRVGLRREWRGRVPNFKIERRQPFTGLTPFNPTSWVRSPWGGNQGGFN